MGMSLVWNFEFVQSYIIYYVLYKLLFQNTSVYAIASLAT